MSRSRPLPRLDAFPCQSSDVLRYGDIDAQGHVNNAVYMTLFESGRVALLRDRQHQLAVPGAANALARIEIDFRRELTWPATVVTGTAVTALGRTSYRLLQALFHDGECAAVAHCVMVLIDGDSRRPLALPDDLIARLKPMWLVETE